MAKPNRMPIARSEKCTAITIIGPDYDFDVLFYGLTERDLMIIPNDYIAEFMERRRFLPENGFNSSPFTVRAIR